MRMLMQLNFQDHSVSKDLALLVDDPDDVHVDYDLSFE